MILSKIRKALREVAGCVGPGRRADSNIHPLLPISVSSVCSVVNFFILVVAVCDCILTFCRFHLPHSRTGFRPEFHRKSKGLRNRIPKQTANLPLHYLVVSRRSNRIPLPFMGQ